MNIYLYLNEITISGHIEKLSTDSMELPAEILSRVYSHSIENL